MTLEIAHLDVFVHMRDGVLINDSMSFGSDLETHPSGRSEVPTVVEVDKSSKSLLFGLGQYIEDK
jgi:hypothetical protein